MSMLRRFLVILAVTAFSLTFSGCFSIPETSEESVAPPQINRNQGFVVDAFKNLANGSPRSLREAYRILDDADGLSDYAQDLKYLSSWLYNILYSSLSQTIPQVEAIPNSYFASIANDIAQGVYPVTKIEESSYLFFILPPLSILFTDSTDTLEIAYESLTVGHDLNPEGTLPLFLLGYVEEKRGNNDEAITWYISALQKSRECYPAAYGMVRIFIQEGRYEEAELILSEASEAVLQDADFLYLSGQVNLALDRYSRAREYFAEAQKILGNDPKLLLGISQALFSQNETEEALEMVRQARQLGAGTVETAVLEAEILRFMEQRIKALSVVDQAQIQYPDNQQLRDLKAQLLLETGRSDESRLLLQDVGSQGYVESLERDVLLLKSAVNASLWQEALIYFQQAVGQSRNTEVLKLGAAIFENTGETEGALKLYQEMSDSDPEQSEYPLRALELAREVNNRELAAEMIKRLEGMELNTAQQSSLKVGEAFLSAGSSNEKKLLEEALFLSVRNENALLGLADYHIRTGDPHRAALYLRQLERMPDLDKKTRDRILILKEQLN